MSSIRIRPLTTFDELEDCVALQKETWGRRFDDVVSAALMLVAQKIGGIASGAFDEDGALAGIVFGLTGIRNDRPVHWSHMLAVAPGARGQGLGRLLKLYQLERVVRLGIDRMYWTFDPLEARNAHFNINVLKVEVDEYVADMYGTGESSPLHSGIGTDRFVVRWDLDGARKTFAEELQHLDWEDGGATAQLPFGAHEGPVFLEDDLASATLVEIPPDIQHLKRADAEKAMVWRTISRAALTHYLSRGARVRAFARDPETGATYYVLDSADGQ